MSNYLNLGELLIDLNQVSALSKKRKWSAEKLYYYEYTVFIGSAKLDISEEDYGIMYDLLTKGEEDEVCV